MVAPIRTAGAALRLLVFAFALSALSACGGGGDPSPIRPDDTGKGISSAADDEVDCQGGVPDVETFSVQEEGSGKKISDGGATQSPSVQVHVTLRDTLPKGCVVRVIRNDQPQPRGLTSCDRNCTFTDQLPSDGEYEYRVRTEAGGTVNTPGTIFGNLSDTYRIELDRVPPVEAVSNIVGPNGKSETRDLKPTISGTVSARLGTGKLIRLERGSGESPTSFELLGQLAAKDQNWTYQEPTALSLDDTGLGVYTYRARVVDTAGNESGEMTLKLSINRRDPYTATTASIGKIDDRAPVGGLAPSTNKNAPKLEGALTAALTNDNNGEQIAVVYADGARLGEAAVNGLSWSFDVKTPLADGDRVLRVRVEKRGDPTEFGESTEVTLPIDTIPPRVPVIYGLSNNRPFQFQAGIPSKFNTLGQTLEEVRFGTGAIVTDPDPRVVLEFTIAKGETLTIKRTGAADTVIATPGTASMSFRIPAALSRPPAKPTTASQAQSFSATLVDAAGNSAESGLGFTIATVDCNQTRALGSTKPEISNHKIWRSDLGLLLCSGCHLAINLSGNSYIGIQPTRAGVAETNSLKEPNSYWCRKG